MHFKRLITSKPEMASRLSADITHIYEHQKQLSRFSSTSLHEGEILFCKILNKFVNLKKMFCLVFEDILLKRFRTCFFFSRIVSITSEQNMIYLP